MGRKKEGALGRFNLQFLIFCIFLSPPLHAATTNKSMQPFFPRSVIDNAKDVVSEDGLDGRSRGVADVLPIALYAISNYYIDKPNFTKLCLTGFKKLVQTDTRYSLFSTTNQIALKVSGKSIFVQNPLPSSDDYKGWSVTLVKALQAMNDNGFKPSFSSEDILYTLLKGVASEMDIRSKYLPPNDYDKGPTADAHTPVVKDKRVSSKIFGNIFYLRIPHFEPTSFPEIMANIKDSHNKYKGVILDLRDNFGGNLEQAVDIADAFLGYGLIATSEGRHSDSHQKFMADTADYIQKKPLVILMNHNSASSSEVLSAALQDRNRAVIVGTKSYGKGTIQRVQRLPNGGSMVMTWAHLFTANGRSLNHEGVMPHVNVEIKTGANADFIDRLSAYKTPTGLDEYMRIAYVLLTNPELYNQAQKLK